MSCNLIQLVAAVAAAIGGSLDPTLAQVRYLNHFDGANGTNSTDTATKGSFVYGSVNSANTKFGQSAMPFGASTYLALNANTADDVLLTKDFCIEFFVYIPSNKFNTNKGLFGHNGTGANTISLTLRADGKLLFGSGTSLYVSTDSIVTGDQWHHIAMTRRGTKVTLWFNGKNVGSATATNWNITGSPYYIGWGAVPTTTTKNYSDGIVVDEFRMCVGAAVYDAEFTPPTQPFTLPAA